MLLELHIGRIVAELVVRLRRVASFLTLSLFLVCSIIGKAFKAGEFYLFLEQGNPTEEKQGGRSEDWAENPGTIFVVEIMTDHGVKLHDVKLE